MTNTRKVLVLFSFRNHKKGYIEMLFDRLQSAAARSQPELELYRGSLSDMHIAISANTMTIRESLTGLDLADFDTIYFELWYKAQQQALAASLYAQQNDVEFFSHELTQIMPVTKVGELARLAGTGVPIPDSFMSSSREISKLFKTAALISFPCIVKAADGYGGNNNFLVRDYERLTAILAEHKQLQFVVQEFIPNDCDYRCLVMGGKIVLVLRRTRAKDADTHLNNTSQGAEGEIIDVSSLPLQARADVLRAADVLGRSEFAGVDLIINSDNGKHYVLEVNQTPQIEIGAAIDQKMDALLAYIAGRTNKSSVKSDAERIVS